MKKIIIALLLLISIVFAVSSCGEHVPAENPGNNSGENSGGNNTGGETPGGSATPPDGGVTPPEGGENSGTVENPGEEAPKPFTVTVMLNGSVYTPPTVADDSKAMKVRLTDGQSYHTVNLGSDGKVSIEGLDGDYTVTLLNVPDKYTYNPNIYKVSSDSRDCVIELLTIIKTTGSGAGLYAYEGCIKIRRTGVYRATVKQKKGEVQVVYYEFTPPSAGVYSVESIMDVSAEMYNPLINTYNGTSAYKDLSGCIDGGGASGSYTKNFKYTIAMDEEYMGACYTFGIFVEGKDAVYPVNVDFQITYLGDYQEEFTSSEIIIPEFIPSDLNYFDMILFSSIDEKYISDFLATNPTYKWFENYRDYLELDMEKFGSEYTDASVYIDNKYVFQEDFYRLNPEDGYYHVYDETKYAAYGGWGPILYASVSTSIPFLEYPLNQVEYMGNKALTVSEGTENFKLFIEGSYELTLSHGDSGPYFCNNTCSCYKTYESAKNSFFDAVNAYRLATLDGNSDFDTIKKLADEVIKWRNNVLKTNGGVCNVSCTDCNPTCRRLPDVNKFQMGYANIAMGGRVPVTEELKIFLQKLSESQRYFSDGNGWVETFGYTAFEDSQWLFACGYYTGGKIISASRDYEGYPECNTVALSPDGKKQY